MQHSEEPKKKVNLDISSDEFEKESASEYREGETEVQRNERREEERAQYQREFDEALNDCVGGRKKTATRFIMPIGDKFSKGEVRYISKDKKYKIIYTSYSCLPASVAKSARTLKTKSRYFLDFFRKVKEIPNEEKKTKTPIKRDRNEFNRSEEDYDHSVKIQSAISLSRTQKNTSIEKSNSETTPRPKDTLKFSSSLDDFNEMVRNAVETNNENFLEELFGTPGECMKWRIKYNIHPK